MGFGVRTGLTPIRGLTAALIMLFGLFVPLVSPFTVHSQSNSPPLFPSRTFFRLIEVNSVPGNAVGTPVVASDPDHGDQLTYSLSGLDENFFSIDRSSGQLTVRGLLVDQGRTRFFVLVRVTDSGGLSDTVPVTIDVTDSAGDGELVLSSSGVRVGANLSAALNDPDGNLSVIAWNWSSSPNKVAWTDIANADSASYLPGAEDLGKHLRVRATYVDGNGTVRTTELATGKVMETAPFNNPPEFPFFESGVRGVLKAIPVGEPVGLPVLASDLDRDLLTYRLTGDASGFFEIGPHTGQLQAKASIESLQQSRYFGVVEVFDGRGGGDSIGVRIDVVDLLPADTPVAPLEEAAEQDQGAVAASLPSDTPAAPQSASPGSSVAGVTAHTPGAVSTSEQIPQPTAVSTSISTERSAEGINSVQATLSSKDSQAKENAAEEPQNTRGGAREQEESAAAIELPAAPTALEARIAESNVTVSGEGQNSSGLPTLVPLLPWWLSWFLLAFVLAGIAVVALLAWRRFNMDPEPRNALPDPYVGPERRLAPLPVLVSSPVDKREPPVETE